MRKFIVFVCCVFSFVLFDEIKADAYMEVCSTSIQSNESEYGMCGNNFVYVMKDNKEHSSYLIADRGVKYKTGKIVYAGKIGGVDTFYSTGFNYFGVVYDDKGLFTSDNNIWSDISINGVVVYSGKFEDNPFVDESWRSYNVFYNEVGTYLIRQYIGNDLQSVIRVIVVHKEDIDLGIDSVMLGENLVSEKVLDYNKGDLSFNVSGGKYGFGKESLVTVNECKFRVFFNKQLVIRSEDSQKCLKLNENNYVSVVLYDGLERDKEFVYNFKLGNDVVSIKMETSISKIETTSRRIVVKANAGTGNKLDDNYSLYYWSKNPNDLLTYEAFMKNYELSELKGSYSSDRGVILRNSEGVYYLYALAKDDDGSIVVRSDEYVLKKENKNNVIVQDVVVLVVMCLCAALPIFVYLLIRVKDTY